MTCNGCNCSAKGEKVKVLDHGSVELIDSMREDPLLKIVNSARVSFAKHRKALTDRDLKLIDYLMKHKHYSTFRHSFFSFRVAAPLFVFRQWWKHQIGSSYQENEEFGIHNFSGEVVIPETNWNERSGRYVELDPVFYVPKNFRKQSEDNKQGSSGDFDENKNDSIQELVSEEYARSYQTYSNLIAMGVAKEQARSILPQSIYSEVIWTVSLQGLLYWLEMRSDSHAQWEIRQYANAIIDLMEKELGFLVEQYK